MHRVLTSVLTMVVLGSILLASQATAADDCRIYDDVGDKLAIGQYPLGTPMLSFMSREALLVCIDENQGAPVCVFDDIKGAYNVEFGRGGIENHVVGYTEDSAVGNKKRADLIAGVAFGDTIFEVGKKLRALPEDFPQWMFRQNGNHLLIFTDDCIRSSSGALWGYLLAFDQNGVLISVEGALKGYEGPM
ncbi:hypothetical protein [Dongia sp.]|uniref:hypothetical protein n=1 Tax=Dongia sp. TaxID=1977262 RepID=UPI0035AF24A7